MLTVAGYIGAKGIGFKSVFRVTDAPEIHSNGFHFRFDISGKEKSKATVCYILPHLVPPEERVLVDPGWCTNIVLPLTKDKIGLCTKQLTTIDRTLLLFLNKLKKIEVIDKTSLKHKHTTLSKSISPLSPHVVVLSNGRDTDYLLLASKNIKPRVARDKVNMARTALTVALTVSPLGVAREIIEPDQQMCFAFLPVRSYGLKFIVQVSCEFLFGSTYLLLCFRFFDF